MAIASLALIIIFAWVNLIGALGPELSFDALYYHLTLPKLYLQWKKIPVISGGLLYPSGQPQLMEVVYAGALALQGEVLAKIIHWAFGVACVYFLYRLLKRIFDKELAILGALIFYVTPVVGWLSTTAYIDLAVVFFELLALDRFLLWFEGKSKKDLVWQGIFLGLSLSIKLLSWGTLLIYLFLFIFISKNVKKGLVLWFRVTFFALLVCWPWYWRTFTYTGNPFYPLFTQYTQSAYPLIESNLLRLFWIPWELTFKPDSLLTPVYLITLPWALITFPKASKTVKMASIFALLTLVYWFFTPTHSIRYLLPFLPALIIFSLNAFKSPFLTREKPKRLLFGVILFISLLHLGVRVVSNAKFLPVILEKESKREFLSKNLNFDYGDFYDVDGYFKENIKESDLVLVYGVHNLYYLDFPFVHESWADKKTEFTHLLVREVSPPPRFTDWNLIYENPVTKVKLYQVSNEN